MAIVTVSYDILITDENVDDMAETAGYGVSYFSQRADWDIAPTDKGEIIFALKDEDGKNYFLDRDDFRKAFVRIVSEDLCATYIKQYFLNSIRNGDMTTGIDAGDIDSEAGDVLAQIACFGELVYG